MNRILAFSTHPDDIELYARAEETRQRFQKVPSVELRMLGLPDRSVCRRELERYFSDSEEREEAGDKVCRSFSRSENGLHHRRLGQFLGNGAPSTTRTCDLLVRSQTLYPTELWARNKPTLESNIEDT